jgi:hypothetical protein
MPYPCPMAPACNKEYSEQRGLSVCMHFCKAYATWNSRLKHALEDHSSELTSNSAKRVRLSPRIDPDDEFEDSTGRFKSPANVSNAPKLEIPQASPPPVSISFSGCRRRAPPALRDYLPHALVGLALHLHPAPPKPTEAVHPLPTAQTLSPVPSPEPQLEPLIVTETNNFGLYQQYI